MTTLIARIRIVVAAFAILALAGFAAPASAQQVNPTADAVKELQLLQQLGKIDGRCTLPDQKACTIEQPAGRDWRAFHEGTLPWIGGVTILGILAVLLVFFVVRGRIRVA